MLWNKNIYYTILLQWVQNCSTILNDYLLLLLCTLVTINQLDTIHRHSIHCIESIVPTVMVKELLLFSRAVILNNKIQVFLMKILSTYHQKVPCRRFRYIHHHTFPTFRFSLVLRTILFLRTLFHHHRLESWNHIFMVCSNLLTCKLSIQFEIITNWYKLKGIEIYLNAF